MAGAMLASAERPPAPHRHPPGPDGLYQWCPDVDFRLHNFKAEMEWWHRYQEGYREVL